MTSIAHLPGRGVLAVRGADRVEFLNGLVSNDVADARPGHAVWSALLTPQGKYLADFFIFGGPEALFLDCEAAQAEDLMRRLSRYRLRASVSLSPEALHVHAAWNGPPPETGSMMAPDPRLPDAGFRLLCTHPLAASATAEDYDRHRLRLGLPDGTRDLEPDKTVLLEAGFDELNGVSWTKGCYMGQELTARTRYRGLIKRRLLPVQGQGRLPPAGTPIRAGEREAGQMRSSSGTIGLATLRLESLDAGLMAADVPIAVQLKDWMRLPEKA